MAATLAHPLRGVLTTDPGTTRATDRLADAVLRAVEGDLARPGRDDGAERSGDRAARAAGPGAPNFVRRFKRLEIEGGDKPVTRRFAA